MMVGVRFVELTIASGAAVSDAFAFQGQRVVGVVTPGTWTAGDITFELNYPSGTSEYHLVSGDANQADIIITGPGDGRVASTNTGSEANVNQGADRTVMVVLA
jgi:hypothetical protein